MIGNKLEPFKFWCQKVLPNVYDDSLSYYEYLCKLNEYLNEVIEQINTLTDNMEDYETDLTAQWTTYRDNLTAQWTETKNYIDNYFNNLNVQTEINNKLDQMVEDGTLDAIIVPILNQYEATIDGIIAEQNQKITNIEGDITSLDDRVTAIANLPEGSTTGDAELIDIRTPYSQFNSNSAFANAGNSVRGQIAQLSNIVQFTKDNFNELLKTEFDFVNNLFDGVYQNRFIDSSTGQPNVNVDVKYLSSVNYIPVTPGVAYMKNLPFTSINYSLWLYYYENDYTFISYQYIGSPQSTNTLTIPSNCGYMKFMITSSSDLPLASVDKCVIITTSILENKTLQYKSEITTGDIDDILACGSYNIDTTNISNIDNLPSEAGGTLLVVKGFGGNKSNVTQIYFDGNNDFYFRYVLLDGTPFSDWNKANTNFSDLSFLKYRKNISSGNLNNYLRCGTYNINNDDVANISNLPISSGGTLIVFKGFGGYDDSVTQFYCSANKNVFFRFVLNNATPFINWVKLKIDNNEQYVERIVVTAETASSVYNSLASNLPINSEIACSKSWFTDLTQFEAGWYYIKTVPTTQNTGATSQRLQILISGTGNGGTIVPPNPIVAIRYLVTNSAYTDWTILCSGQAETRNYIAFGDSVCRGNHPDSTKSIYAYPEMFAKYQRIKCQNLAISGQGYLSTRYAVKAIETIQATDITNANVISLSYGINDASDNDVVIGTINDTTEETVFGELYRCMIYIYSQNKKVQLIICGTTRQSGTWSTRLAEINEKLKLFCEKYNIAFVDMTQCPINQFNGTTSDGLTTDGTHFNDTGYLLLSQYMVAQLSNYYSN